MKTILKTFFLLVALSAAVPVLAQPDFEATKALAEAGDVTSQHNLGFMYANGMGVARNDQEAVRWYRQAAEKGLASSQYNLGVMYANGVGLAQSDQEAVKWYQFAAEQGLADAQYNLGLMYDSGIGAAQSYSQAVRFYRLAAEQGLADAQYSLGAMYGNGHGVEQDYRKAYVWYSVAAAQGYLDASTVRDSVRAQLSQQAIEQAQAQATRCLESNFKDCESEGHYSYDYSPPNCAYAVTFPDMPSLNQMYADGIGEYISANLERDGYFLRAECIPVGNIQPYDSSQLLSIAKEYVEFNGLQRASYETLNSTLGEIVNIRGYKAVNEMMATFSVTIISGSHSYISLYAATDSTSYPRKEISDFLASVRSSD
jgi:TPR repeat protein